MTGNTRHLSTSAVAAHRRRLRSMGLRRVEVQVPERDVPLVRAVAAALLDPERAGITRALLLTRLGPEPSRRLKFLLAASPLGGVETDQETPGQAG